jgi:hypothetical protein
VLVVESPQLEADAVADASIGSWKQEMSNIGNSESARNLLESLNVVV